MNGERDDHARTLAESDALLPPIVVQRSTMRVVDGMHRLRAAIYRGETEIQVRFFDGDDDDAFILAVETNIAHGLPLSLSDRVAAVARIVAARPEWSDRRVAGVAGVSATTVGTVRRRSTARPGQSNMDARVGRDGRARPIDQMERRIRASELIRSRPNATLREIAAAAAVSPATALDVRNRLRDGADPVPDRLYSSRDGSPARAGRRRPRGVPAGKALPPPDCETVLRNLKKDPSLRFSEAGRDLLRWLDFQTTAIGRWKQYVDSVPPHCADVIADVARRNGEAWLDVVRYLQRRPS